MGVGVNDVGIVVIEGVKFSICVGIVADVVKVDVCSGAAVIMVAVASAGSNNDVARFNHILYAMCCIPLDVVFLTRPRAVRMLKFSISPGRLANVFVNDILKYASTVTKSRPNTLYVLR